MINQDLINRVTVYLANEKPLKPELARELLDSYISLIEQNAELHKENARLNAYNKTI